MSFAPFSRRQSLRTRCPLALPQAVISLLPGVISFLGSIPIVRIATTLTSRWRAKPRDGWQSDSQRRLIWYVAIFRPQLSLKVNMHNTCTLNLQPTADVLGCNVYSDGTAAAIDTWNPSGIKTNVLDKDQVSSLKYM